jgi:four helix bundle protein
MQDFRKLTMWQAARRLTRTVYELTSDFPQSEEFGIKAQMRRASVSICSNIAEGCGRSGDREFRFLTVAMGSACELECALIIACDLSFVTRGTLERTLPVLVETERMLTGLMNRLTSSDG